MEYPCTNCQKKIIDYYGYLGYCRDCELIKEYQEGNECCQNESESDGETIQS